MAGHRDAVEAAGHLDVRHHQVEVVTGVDQPCGLVAGAGLDHLEAAILQTLGQD